MGQQAAGSARQARCRALPRGRSVLEDRCVPQRARGQDAPDRILADIGPLNGSREEEDLLVP